LKLKVEVEEKINHKEHKNKNYLTAKNAKQKEDVDSRLCENKFF